MIVMFVTFLKSTLYIIVSIYFLSLNYNSSNNSFYFWPSGESHVPPYKLNNWYIPISHAQNLWNLHSSVSSIQWSFTLCYLNIFVSNITLVVNILLLKILTTIICSCHIGYINIWNLCAAAIHRVQWYCTLYNKTEINRLGNHYIKPIKDNLRRASLIFSMGSWAGEQNSKYLQGLLGRSKNDNFINFGGLPPTWPWHSFSRWVFWRNYQQMVEWVLEASPRL